MHRRGGAPPPGRPPGGPPPHLFGLRAEQTAARISIDRRRRPARPNAPHRTPERQQVWRHTRREKEQNRTGRLATAPVRRGGLGGGGNRGGGRGNLLGRVPARATATRPCRPPNGGVRVRVRPAAEGQKAHRRMAGRAPTRGVGGETPPPRARRAGGGTVAATAGSHGGLLTVGSRNDGREQREGGCGRQPDRREGRRRRAPRPRQPPPPPAQANRWRLGGGGLPQRQRHGSRAASIPGGTVKVSGERGGRGSARPGRGRDTAAPRWEPQRLWSRRLARGGGAFRPASAVAR